MKKLQAPLTIILIVSIILTFSTTFVSLSFGSDLVSFITGAQRVKQYGGQELYRIDTQLSVQNEVLEINRDALLPFRSPPFVAVMFLPFTFFSLSSSYFLFGALTIFLVFYFSYQFSKLDFALDFWIISFVSLLFWPTLKTIISGQLSIILLLTFLGIYISQRKQNAFAGGICTGILCVKPQLLVALPFIFLLFRQRKEYLKGLLLITIPLILLSIYLTGFPDLLEYIPFLITTETVNYGSRYWHMFSLGALLDSFNFPATVNYILNFCLLGAMIGIVYLRRKLITADAKFVLSVVGAIVFSVHVLDHDLVLLLFPIFLFIAKKYFFLAAMLFLVPLSVFFSQGHWFSLVLVCLMLLLIYDKKLSQI